MDEDGGFERVSGTSLGGGTLWGLLSLLTDARSFDGEFLHWCGFCLRWGHIELGSELGGGNQDEAEIANSTSCTGLAIDVSMDARA